MAIKSLSETELNQLAKDLDNGNVWTDRHCRNEEELKLCFPILYMMDAETRKKLETNKPFMIYEHINKAMSRGANGLPMFMSFHTLNKKDTKVVNEKVLAIREAIKTALK